jgi:hypothetical protein
MEKKVDQYFSSQNMSIFSRWTTIEIVFAREEEVEIDQFCAE